MPQRPGLVGEAREQLVGLKPVGAVRELLAGAHLFDPEDAAISANDQGYITSVGVFAHAWACLGARVPQERARAHR